MAVKLHLALIRKTLRPLRINSYKMKTRHEQIKSRFLEAAQTPMLMRLKHDFKVHHDFPKKNKHGFNFVIIICDIMLIHTNNFICILL